MNPQNPNDYQNQQPPQNYPPAPGQPQVYGPQQYSPMPVPNNGMPGQAPPKNNKKLLIAVVVAAVLLIVIIVIAVFMNLQSGGNSPSTQKITRTYDSPAGLLPGMQAADVRSGKFKLTASYVTGGNFTREGEFSVKDGHMSFGMISDDKRANELLKYLHERRSPKVPYDAQKHGADRNLSYDFSSMLGYHYLYDRNAGTFSGFIPAVEAAKAATKPDKRYTLTTTCDSALADVKAKTDMNTTDLTFEFQQEGVNKTKANVSFATLREIDKSVHAFFDGCFDLEQPAQANLKKFVDKLREDVTKSPTFTYWQEEGVNYLEVSAPPGDAPFGGKLHFELTELGQLQKEAEGTLGSYIERRNQFGLAYSLCRIDPVITKSQEAGYRFTREDPAYSYPAITDTGYYCRTLDVPSQFKPAQSATLKSTTGANVTVSGAAIDGLRGWHDLVYETEQFNLNSKRYPGSIEFRDIANSNMGDLTSTTQAMHATKSMVYTALPGGCVGTCNDFVLSFVPAPNVQVQRTTYKP